MSYCTYVVATVPLFPAQAIVTDAVYGLGGGAGGAGGPGGGGQLPAAQPGVAVPGPDEHRACTTSILAIPTHGSPKVEVFGHILQFKLPTHSATM